MSHDGPGTVAMANKGPDSSSSQFYIALDKLDYLDGENVVIGKIKKQVEFIHHACKASNIYSNRHTPP
jgi:cyclophilin family peptidyl-prolyl cis-trans isomerase